MASWLERIDKWDAVWQFPRPANAQHLPGYQAFLRMVEDATTVGSIMFCAALSALFIFLTGHLFQTPYVVGVLVYALMLIVLSIGLVEAGTVLYPYYRINQLTTYGTARWADRNDLERAKMLIRIGDPIPPGWVVIGRFKGRYYFVLPVWEWLRHIVIYGASGSGKSKTFFMWMLRYVARGGSAIVVDPKPEMYQQTAHHFKRTYRLDLKNPERSDRWNFVPRCAADPEFAHAMAAMMIGLEFSRKTNADPFWGDAEHVACTAILMFLSTVVDVPTPSMVYEYVALRDDEGFAADMTNCENRYVRLAWRAFQKAPKPTQGSVMIGLSNKLYPFFMHNARAVFTPPTEEERELGVSEIEFQELRRPGTAIYLIISEGDAFRYKEVLSTFIGQAVYELRADEETEKTTPCMLLMEEAYNIPVPEIKRISGVGRGRGLGLVLCYQNVSQPYEVHGREGANAILGTVLTRVFLPGCDEVTAEYASKLLGATTTLSRTDVDAPGKKYDNRRASETGRPLRQPNEIRQMTPFTEALVVTGAVPPIRCAFPTIALEYPESSHPRYKMPKLLNFEEAEAQFNERRAQEMAAAAGGAGGGGGAVGGGPEEVTDGAGAPPPAGAGPAAPQGQPEARAEAQGAVGGGGGAKPGGGANAADGQPAGTGGPRGRKTEKPAARTRGQELADKGDGVRQPNQQALWTSTPRAIKDGAARATEQVGERARVITKTVERSEEAGVHDDDLILNGAPPFEPGSHEHVDAMFK